MATLKNKSDLAEFPDGGRATLVRRYSPALTQRQMKILRACPYENPGFIPVANPWRRVAMVLVRARLLELNPENPTLFRVTDAGREVVERWANAGW